MNTEEHDCGMSLAPADRANMEFSLADKWIESQFEIAAKEFNAHLDNYRLDMAANTALHANHSS